MSQEIDQLATRVAGVVKDEIAAAELRGRTAGEAAGREAMRAEMAGQVKALEERVVELQSQPGAFASGQRLREVEEENRLLREQVEAWRPIVEGASAKAEEVPPKPQADPAEAFAGRKRGRK